MVKLTPSKKISRCSDQLMCLRFLISFGFGSLIWSEDSYVILFGVCWLDSEDSFWGYLPCNEVILSTREGGGEEVSSIKSFITSPSFEIFFQRIRFSDCGNKCPFFWVLRSQLHYLLLEIATNCNCLNMSMGSGIDEQRNPAAQIWSLLF